MNIAFKHTWKTNQIPRWRFCALLLSLLLAIYGGTLLEKHLLKLPFERTVNTVIKQEAAVYLAIIDNFILKKINAIDLLAASPDTFLTLKTPENKISKWLSSARVLKARSPRKQWAYRARNEIQDVSEIHLLGTNNLAFPLPHNYIALSQYEQALKGFKPPPQAAKIDSWALFIARPVHGDNNTTEGVLLVDISLTYLHQLLVNNRTPKGHLRLVQRVQNNQAGTLLHFGSAPDSAIEVTLATAVPNWELKFRGSTELTKGIKQNNLKYIMAISLLFFVTLFTGLFILKIRVVFTSSIDGHPVNDHHNHLPTKSPVDLFSASSTVPDEIANPQIINKQYFPTHVFRDYDIRGVAFSEISEYFSECLGKVLGTRQLEAGGNLLVVAEDGRLSSPRISKALTKGILSTGCDTINLGMVPTPVMNFYISTSQKVSAGVMVTASHNPGSDNGFKIIFDRRALSSEEITFLHTRMRDSPSWRKGTGTEKELLIIRNYIDAISRDILEPSDIKVVIDCCNGVAAKVAPKLFKRMGCKVIKLHCDIDGNFPNHPPDPTIPENLTDLIETVTKEHADIGLAFDGDGDRLVVVSSSGKIVWPDELMMILARDVITRTPGANIVFDVKSTKRLPALISNYGGHPLMEKTGHAHIRRKMSETGALLGGEFSGHLFFNDRWHGFDDGLYAGARLLEIMSLREQSLDDMLDAFPQSVATAEIKIAVSEDKKFAVMDALQQLGDFNGADIITIDGLRVEYPKAWGLVRASNTSAALTLRFEADSDIDLTRIQAIFRAQLLVAEPGLKLDF